MQTFSKPALFLLTIFSLFACSKDEPSELELGYADVLKNLIIPGGGSTDTCDYFMKVEVLGKTWAYCDDVENPKRNLFIVNKFMTPGPSIVLGGAEGYKYARRGAMINFPDYNYKPYEPHVEIHMPDFDLNRDPIAYLDSMFAIKNHRFMSASEVVVPKDAGIADAALTKAEGGFLTGWKIKIMLPMNDPQVSKLFIQSVMGEQDDSYLRIDEVFKIDDGATIQYYLDFSFQANLYHHPQYGEVGLFSVLRNGRFKGVLTVLR